MSITSKESKESKEIKELKERKEDGADAPPPLSFFHHFNQTIKPEKPLRFEVWKERIEARLKIYTLEELITCVDNLAASEWHRDKKLQTIDQIVRDDESVEKWLQRVPSQSEEGYDVVSARIDKEKAEREEQRLLEQQASQEEKENKQKADALVDGLTKGMKA